MDTHSRHSLDDVFRVLILDLAVHHSLHGFQHALRVKPDLLAVSVDFVVLQILAK